MSKQKNQNSILVLATLGVYLGLVLVGGTPQILAQAAMTKQFNVKDEIEYRDGLDKKPESGEAIKTEDLGSVDQKVANSVDRFLSQFHTSARDACSLELVIPSFEFETFGTGGLTKTLSKRIEKHRNIGSILTPTNLPRAGPCVPLATDAK